MNINTWWSWLNETFNNRELATGFWVCGVLLYLLLYHKTREHLSKLFKVLFQWKLLLLFGSFALYVAGLCWLLNGLYLWSIDQLPQTLIWFFFSGAVLLGRSFNTKEEDRFFRTMFWDSFRIIVIFEFVVVAYSFSLPVELVLVPLTAFLGMLIAYTTVYSEYRQVKTFLEIVAALVVLFFFWNSVILIFENPEEFVTTENGKNFLLPIFLTILSIPIIYVWHCYSHIENAKIRIQMKTFQPKDVKRYAQKRFILTFMARPWLLHRAVRQFHNIPAMSKEDVNQIVSGILAFEREADNPPEVDPRAGWSPHVARDFLKDHGLRTGDYHADGFGEGWFASSDYKELDDGLLQSRASFYLEGDADTVRRLKLKGFFNIDFYKKEALSELREIAIDLISIATGEKAEGVQMILPENFVLDENIEDTRVLGGEERFPNGTAFEYYIILERG
ncbi:hypothetical protein C6W92_06625 [Roseovarius sp. A46]|uniref:hypothetical protein n=1 Tax=Roseovarius sp. A46 TaxID=2109331 RepID=UPI0010102CA5|nr:hypothetical protein [Roseovarius sp. A46]RXV64725.1 hypothetical protein C6W92_06625 [Roseovarius sp. A46]